MRKITLMAVLSALVFIIMLQKTRIREYQPKAERLDSIMAETRKYVERGCTVVNRINGRMIGTDTVIDLGGHWKIIRGDYRK